MQKLIDDPILIYDTTLRDGSQGEGINFSLADKIRVALKLDAFGMDYVEGGWPGSNEKDSAFFKAMKDIPLTHARLVAFGATRHPEKSAATDALVQAVSATEAPAALIVGKTWGLHVRTVLRTSADENVNMIRDTISFLAARMPEVQFAGEHFFDAYKSDPAYALTCLQAAEEAGAQALVLADTNGGSLPHEIGEIVREVCRRTCLPVAIHAHDDTGCGVANSLAAVHNGARIVQGTINGYGERCGNANLIPIIANIRLKLHRKCLLPHSLSQLTALSDFLADVTDIRRNPRQPYVGRCAFTHKAGSHADGVLKESSTYEHVPPESVGNSRRLLVSELAGGSMVAANLSSIGLKLEKGSSEARSLLTRIGELEMEGYSFDEASASFELIARRLMGLEPAAPTIQECRVDIGANPKDWKVSADLRLYTEGHEYKGTAAHGDVFGAVEAAARQALSQLWQWIADVSTGDCRWRTITNPQGEQRSFRALLQCSGFGHLWTTVGVASDPVRASLLALFDGLQYGKLVSKNKEIFQTSEGDLNRMLNLR